MTGTPHKILKILSGPNAGAEAALPYGEYSFGSDGECDIILADSAVAAQHMMLTINEEGVNARPAGGTVLFAGEAMDSDGVPIEDFTVLTIGGTHICLGPSDEPWPNIPLPSLLDGPSKQEEPEEPEEEQKVEADSEETKQADPQFKNYMIAGTIAVLLLAAIWLLFLRGPSLSPAEKLRAALDKHGFATLQVMQNGTEISIDGLLDTQQQRDRLEELLQTFKPVPDTDIRILESLAFTLQNTLQKKGLPLGIANIGGGTLRVAGFVGSKDAANGVRTVMKPVEDEGIKVKYLLTDWKTLKPELETIMRARKLDGKLKFTPGMYMIETIGSLNNIEQVRWEEAQKEISDLLQGPAPFFSTAEELEPQKKTRPAPVVRKKLFNKPRLNCFVIKAVNKNGRRFVKVNGRLYDTGDLMPSGYRVQEISQKIIVLVRKDHTLYCPAGGN